MEEATAPACLLKTAGAGFKETMANMQGVVKENTTSKSALIVQIQTDNDSYL